MKRINNSVYIAMYPFLTRGKLIVNALFLELTVCHHTISHGSIMGCALLYKRIIECTIFMKDDCYSFAASYPLFLLFSWPLPENLQKFVLCTKYKN
jgi:hypothetical protein